MAGAAADDGNVRGWFWFYFMNEHVLRYLNLRVPRDYDTVPLLVFWGLCLGLDDAVVGVSDLGRGVGAAGERGEVEGAVPCGMIFRKLRARVLLAVWAAFALVFFALSTRQEYYVLPAFPALAVLGAGGSRGWITSAATAEKGEEGGCGGRGARAGGAANEGGASGDSRDGGAADARRAVCCAARWCCCMRIRRVAMSIWRRC